MVLIVPDAFLINPSILRIVRCLRPLKTARFVRGVRSAMNSWQYLLNIGLMLLFSMTMFAILGVQLFGGALAFGCLGQMPLSGAATPDLANGSSLGAEPIVDLGRPIVECPPQISCPTGGCVLSDLVGLSLALFLVPAPS